MYVGSPCRLHLLTVFVTLGQILILLGGLPTRKGAGSKGLAESGIHHVLQTEREQTDNTKFLDILGCNSGNPMVMDLGFQAYRSLSYKQWI